jgi:hypothetical protein
MSERAPPFMSLQESSFVDQPAHVRPANDMSTIRIPTFRRGMSVLALAASAAALASCSSNDGLEDRLDRRNDGYSGFQERREMRQDARQERTDAWFDRVMH